MRMPTLPIATMVANFTTQEKEIVLSAFTTRGIKKPGYGRLRANKPFPKVKTYERGCANYVWRLLCFDLAGFGKHTSMPVCADFDICEALEALDGKHVDYSDPRRRDLMTEMDNLIKRFESTIPLSEQKGIVQWGRALGMI